MENEEENKDENKKEIKGEYCIRAGVSVCIKFKRR